MNFPAWRIKLLAIISLAGIIIAQSKNLLDSDPATTFDLDAIFSGLTAMTLLFVRDNKVTSEQAGAGK